MFLLLYRSAFVEVVVERYGAWSRFIVLRPMSRNDSKISARVREQLLCAGNFWMSSCSCVGRRLLFPMPGSTEIEVATLAAL